VVAVYRNEYQPGQAAREPAFTGSQIPKAFDPGPITITEIRWSACNLPWKLLHSAPCRRENACPVC